MVGCIVVTQQLDLSAPTCKSSMLDASLIPLYGQGSSNSKPGIPNHPSHINCTGYREVEEDHPVMSNFNYGTWIDDDNFRNYRGLAGFAIGLKYEHPFRRLDEHSERQGIWNKIWLRLLLSALLVFVVHFALWC
jgi:hypothetical protein